MVFQSQFLWFCATHVIYFYHITPHTTSDWFCVIVSANRTTRCNLVPAVATSECCSGRELRHWAPHIISNPFCRSLSYIFGQSHLLTLWQGITEGRVAVEKGKEKPIFLLHFISYKVPDSRALCVTVMYCTDLPLKRWFFFGYCIKLRRPFHLCSVHDYLTHQIYSF